MLRNVASAAVQPVSVSSNAAAAVVSKRLGLNMQRKKRKNLRNVAAFMNMYQTRDHWQPLFLKKHSQFDGKSVTSDVRNVFCCLGVFYFLWEKYVETLSFVV